MSDKIRHLKRALDQYPLDKNAKGLVRMFLYDPKTCEIKKLIELQNLILFSGADILSQVLLGKVDYAVATMYMEFKNGGGPVTIPAFGRDGGIMYYSGLSGSLDRDFLRVPITINPTISSSDEVNYDGNQVTFFAISEGSVGRHGKPFSQGDGSVVYGAALVATPEPLDPTLDVVFSRVYSGIGEVEKQTGFEVGITWTIRFN